MHQFQPFLRKRNAERGDPSNVATGSIETGNQPRSNWIDTGCENYWNGLGSLHRCPDRDDTAARNNDCHLPTDEIGCKSRKPIELPFRPSEIPS
jgi:hypothetical protein